MKNRVEFLRVFRPLALGGLLAATSLAAIAQTAPTNTAKAAGEAELQEVVVTGSRIASPNMQSASPIQVVSARDIQTTGKTDISDIINQLPQVFNNDLGQDLGNRTSGLTSAGGVATADLRGLGPNRTLVLVDGRRLGQGSPNTAIQSPAPDLDQIPANLVERVEVVTGGASAVYGSDAIAGVVNFIMKRNYEGLQIDGQYGLNLHDNHNTFAQQANSDAGYNPLTGRSTDGRNKNFSLLIGTNFADNRGNITGYLNYFAQDGVKSGQRDFGQCGLFENQDDNGNVIGAACSGSGNSNYFRPEGIVTGGVYTQNIGKAYSVFGTSFVPRGSVATTPPAVFNSQTDIYLQRQDQRYQGGFMAHYDAADYAKPYAEFFFMNDRTHQEIAPSALFRDSNPNDANTGNYNVNCSNPLLSAQEAGILCTPAQISADAAAPGSVLANVRIGRRNVEGGGRTSDYEHTNFRTVFGIKGDFATAWNYDAYGQYYYTQFYQTNDRYLNFINIDNALLATGTAANPVCISGGSCVPYNIFSDNGVTQKQLGYLYTNGTSYGTTTLRTLHADVTGELGKYGIQLPWATEGLGVNIGWENRNENVKYDPDSAEQSGQLSGAGGASVAIDNSVSVSEEFAELRIPIVQDKPFAKDLVFDTGIRRSDYSVSGTVNTFKFEVQYAPIADVHLRGSFNRAIRAPSIIELFNPQVVGLIQLGDDPCAPGSTSGVATASLAQCQHSGVTAGQYGNGIAAGTTVGGVVGTNTIPQATLGQLSQAQGGNPNLQPEVATTYSIGATFTPEALRNFTGSIDYYHIKINGEVSVLPAGLILNNCLNTGDPTFCSQLVRSPNTGGLVGNNLAGGGYIAQTNINIGSALLSGIDVQLGYKLDMARFGALAFSLNGAYLLKSDSTPVPGGPTYDCAGLYGTTCQTVNPRWHHIFRTSWLMPWDVTASMTWRYIGSVTLDNNSHDPSLAGKEYQNPNTGGPAFDFFNARLPSMSYLDLAVSWEVAKTLQLRAGASNILDKDPPLVTNAIAPGGSPNTYGLYEALGRQLYVAFTARF